MSYQQVRPYSENQIKYFKTRDTTLAFMPMFPDSVKAGDVRNTLERQRGLSFTDSQWQTWLRHLIQDRRLIRLPGSRMTRPRGPSDYGYHVPPRTKAVKVPRLTLAQQLKAANAALNLQLKNNSQK